MLNNNTFLNIFFIFDKPNNLLRLDSEFEKKDFVGDLCLIGLLTDVPKLLLLDFHNQFFPENKNGKTF